MIGRVDLDLVGGRGHVHVGDIEICNFLSGVEMEDGENGAKRL